MFFLQDLQIFAITLYFPRRGSFPLWDQFQFWDFWHSILALALLKYMQRAVLIWFWVTKKSRSFFFQDLRNFALTLYFQLPRAQFHINYDIFLTSNSSCSIAKMVRQVQRMVLAGFYNTEKSRSSNFNTCEFSRWLIFAYGEKSIIWLFPCLDYSLNAQ